jgi:hypothetical protein
MRLALDPPHRRYTQMLKAPIVERRLIVRALPDVDLVFLLALGVAGVAACLVIGLR